MKILIILGHPQPGSFNHAMAQTVIQTLKENGHQIIFHDLYAEKFDPILPSEEISDTQALPPEIHQHCRELADAEGIIIIHPNWWGQPPAILKGWIDRVIRQGVAYKFLEGDQGEGIPVGLLRATTAIILNTSNTPEERERKIFSDPLEALWKSCIFDLCGVKNIYRKMYGVIITSSPDQRKEWLNDVRKTINRHFPNLK